MSTPVIPNNIHLTLQGKGGVGKSFVSSILAQYLENKGLAVSCIDTDPVNKTLSSFKALNVTPIEILTGTKIDEQKFDHLMELLLTESGTFVVDNGASSFVPLSSYLTENEAFSALEQSGKKVFIHCIVTGGQALKDTLNGLVSLANASDKQNIIVWLNEYYGDIQHESKSFTDMKAYTNSKDKIAAVIRIPNQNPDTFGKDITQVTKNNLTLKEAIESPDFMLMSKQRLKIFQKTIFDQLDEAALV